MIIYPTVTSNMWHPLPEIKDRWRKKYGRERFTFTEALYAQSFPESWAFPRQKTLKWKWLAEAFPPRVAQHLFQKYVDGYNNTLLDIFAGIGGWGLGAVWSERFNKIIMIERNREKCKYLNHNFSTLGIRYEIICDDINSLQDHDIPRANIVTGSPPCEDLSKLRFFNRNVGRYRGTVPLTVKYLEIVHSIEPEIAFYENVYRKPLIRILKNYGWRTIRFDMSMIIPQKRIRLIGIYDNR